MRPASGAISERSVEIRPGVFRPDWSVVATAAASEALSGRMASRANLLDRWSLRLEPTEDMVWRAVLRLYAELGRPPLPKEVAAEAGIAAGRVPAALRALQARDLIDLQPGADTIRHAYPFTEAATGHRVELRGRSLHALCAVDALGVGAMYRADASVTSRCRSCGAPINVEVGGDEGSTLCGVSPAGAVVWYDFAYAGSAAASCCPAIEFFCSDEHLRGWLGLQRPERSGIRLAMAEALEAGRAIFGPVLAEASSEPPT